MILFKRILIIISIVVIFVIIAASLITYIYGDRIVSRVLMELNKNIRTEIAVEEVSFSMLKKFPSATIEFKNVKAAQTSNISIGDFPATTSDTLFYLQHLFLEFNPFDLLDNNIHLRNIEAVNGQVNMLTDNAGVNGYIFWNSDSTNGSGTYTSSIDNVHIKNVKFLLDDLSNNLLINIYIRDANFKGDFAERQFEMESSGEFVFHHLSVNSRQLIVNKPMEISSTLAVQSDKVSIMEASIQSLNQEFLASGEILLNTPRAIYLTFESDKTDLGAALELVPEAYQEYVEKYKGRGKLSVSGDIKGEISADVFPAVAFTYLLEEGNITHRESKVTLANLFSKGRFYFSPLQETFNVDELSFDSEIGSVEGSIIYTNFRNPDITIDLNGFLELNNFNRFFPNSVTEYLSGGIDFNTRTNFTYKRNKPITKENINISYVDGNMMFNNVFIKLHDRPFLYESINGRIDLGKDISLKNISFEIRKNDFTINGTAENALDFLSGRNKYLWIDAKIHSRQILVDNLLVKDTDQEQDSPLHINFPERANLKLQFTADKFFFRNFSASDAEGIVSYKPRMFVVQSLAFSGMRGRSTANGVISQNNKNDFLVKSQAELNNIDIRQMFEYFNNFGQKTLRDDHLRGTLSGTLSFSSEWTNNLKAKMETVTTEADIEITNGELIEFEPMMGLSRFIELDELKHIRFETLKNHIFIRDRVITIPEMDINSSALNITASGTHDFDNNFLYQIQLLLSDVLAVKVKKKKPTDTSFGMIEDDGIGRTKVYLRIEGNIDDYTVSYDKAQMKEALREDIRDEKKELRTIFNEEFGWFKSKEQTKNAEFQTQQNEEEAQKKVTPATNKSPFKIQWDEVDTLK